MAGNLAVREVPLGGGHLLKFDYCEGLYRVVYEWSDSKDQRGRLVPGGRVTAKNTRLGEALLVVFGEAADKPGARDQDPATVEHYLRSTAWGGDLP